MPAYYCLMVEVEALTTLFADVGGVLIENPWIFVADGLSATYGLDRHEVFLKLELLSKELDRGRIDVRAFDERLSRSVKQDIPQDYFGKLLLELSPKRVAPVWDSLSYLKNAGALRIIALSNMSREYWASLESKFHISGLFDASVLSYELDLIKPDPRIFAVALREAGSPPHLCMFLDDSEPNVQAAERLGVMTHLATGPDETSAFLRSLAR